MRMMQTRKDKYSTGHDCFFSKPEGKPLRINCISIESGLTGAELATPLRWSVKLGMVPHKLIYGLNKAMFESRQESPELTMGNDT